MNKKGQKTALISIVVITILAIVVLLICAMGFDSVEANHIGVKNKFGKVIGTMNPGLQWTGLFVHVYKYNLKTRPITLHLNTTEKSAFTNTGQPVFAKININWRIKSDSVMDIYKNIGVDDQIYNTLNVEGRVLQGFKSVIAEYEDGLQIIENRNVVVDKAEKAIMEQFPGEYLIVDMVVISDLEFEETYQNAISLKKTTEQMILVEEKQIEVETKKAQQIVEAARGEAEAVIINANATAIAYKLQQRELTPLLIEKQLIEAWSNGGSQIPTIVVSGSGGSPFILGLPDINSLKQQMSSSAPLEVNAIYPS